MKVLHKEKPVFVVVDRPPVLHHGHPQQLNICRRMSMFESVRTMLATVSGLLNLDPVNPTLHGASCVNMHNAESKLTFLFRWVQLQYTSTGLKAC